MGGAFCITGTEKGITVWGILSFDPCQQDLSVDTKASCLRHTGLANGVLAGVVRSLPLHAVLRRQHLDDQAVRFADDEAIGYSL